MLVPVHRRRAAGAGKNPQVRPKPAVLIAALAGVMAAIMSNLAHAGASHGGGGSGTAVGLAIGIGAAALGLALARAIGRQGRI
jgi:hypothetical protein